MYNIIAKESYTEGIKFIFIWEEGLPQQSRQRTSALTKNCTVDHYKQIAKRKVKKLCWWNQAAHKWDCIGAGSSKTFRLATQKTKRYSKWNCSKRSSLKLETSIKEKNSSNSKIYRKKEERGWNQEKHRKNDISWQTEENLEKLG